ncbi:MAG: cobalamin-independent methionine synthase II family protein [Stellaceae bacterium]
MRTSTDHILTTHVGSLPRPDDLIAANRAREDGQASDKSAFERILRTAVDDVVRLQKELGVDIPGDGEFGKSAGHRVNYGAWWNYVFLRLGGLRLDGPSLDHMVPRQARPGELVLQNAARRRDRVRFAEAYADRESGVFMGPRPSAGPVCVGPVSYIGHEAVKADIDNFKAALALAGVEEGFMTSVAPGSAYRIPNQHYRSDEEFLYAWAEAMREEYKAIVDAGLILQLDDPATATGWDMMDPEPDVEGYRKFTMVRIQALNHALRGLPEDRIRFHLCWGSWHGPHVTDIPMREIVEVMLKVNAQAYSFEAGNVRHEHEWKVWQEIKLPDDKIILPGVVSHATNVVEHPELVADRILRFANLVGRERVIASTDCGLGGRVHPQIAWAKLEALTQGAALASKNLWR